MLLLVALLIAAGLLHLTDPGLYEPIVPRLLGDARAWVLISGIAELACGIAVLNPATRRVGAFATAGLFVAVFPANITMAVDDRSLLPYLRLPVQVPLILWALYVARGRASLDASVLPRHARAVALTAVAAWASSTVEAELIAGMLNANGVAAGVQADDAAGLHPELQARQGVRVLVDDADLATAQELIASSGASGD